jgi:hypothetical protein
MDRRNQIAKHIASVEYQKSSSSYAVKQSPQQVGCNSQPIYKGARPDQMNPNISGHGNERNGAN